MEKPIQKDVIIISVPFCEPMIMLAPALLATCLENAGITAKGVDFNAYFIKEFSNEDWYKSFKSFLVQGAMIKNSFDKTTFKSIFKFTKRFIQQLINDHDPKYIGLSIFTSESLDFGLILSYIVRRYYPHIKILAGGKGLEVTGVDGRYIYENWIENNLADTIVIGDAETEIIDTIKQNKIGLVAAPTQTIKDLDNIPLTNFNDYDLSLYPKISHLVDTQLIEEESFLLVTSSKGCVRNCTFCDVANFWPDYLYRNPIKVAEEIMHNYRSTGIKKFRFTDNLINGSISNFRKMNQHLATHMPNTINYRGYAIFRGKESMPEEDFELASIAGNTQWTVGVESGSEKVRWEMGKKISDEDLDWSIRMLYKYNIFQNWLLIAGYPSETEEDFDKTLKLLDDYKHFKDKIAVQITPTFEVLPNSPIFQNNDLRKKFGLEDLKLSQYSRKFWTTTINPTNDFPERSRRWKLLIDKVVKIGYHLGDNMPLEKWISEIENYDRIYEEQNRKT